MKKLIGCILMASILVSFICVIGNSCSSRLENRFGTTVSTEHEESGTRLSSYLQMGDLLSEESTTDSNGKTIKTHKATVITVVDGDTIWVNVDGKKKKVRFIGIDTPESVNPDENKNTKEGKLASNYTKKRLKKGMTIYLEYDNDKTDLYGRVLAYIWLKDNVTNSRSDVEKYMYNAELVREGYAKVLTVKPNVKYSDIFDEINNTAKENKKGIWKNE